VISEKAVFDARKHALAEYPLESCGLVVGGEYLPRKNTASRPEEAFRIAPQAWAAAERQGEVQCVIHSHPNQARTPEETYPTEADMRGQMDTDLAWGIIPVINGAVFAPFFWGGETPVPDLYGRLFRRGIADCFALVRDWYRVERGVLLPNHPRPDEWWAAGHDLLEVNFRDAGFERIEDGPQVGDVAMMQVASDKVNHCGVYVGNGLLLQHLTNRVSGTTPLHRWRKTVRMFLRKVR